MGNTQGLIATDAWELRLPDDLRSGSPLLVVPTVHPRGDRRIIRCAQVALDAGFRVHFVWLGEGVPSEHWAASETLLKAPVSRRERILSTREVSRIADALGGDAWHIHDFYMLPYARRWSRKRGGRVLYDVHEYYGRYYSSHLPAACPDTLRRAVSAWVDSYQVRSARRLGAANAVSADVAEPFARGGVPVAVSPNYPLLAHFAGVPVPPFGERRWRVLHTGTLTTEYGTVKLVELARRSLERSLPFEFDVVARFPSPAHERAFRQLVGDPDRLTNMRVLPSRPTHEMPGLIARYGFGLSLLTPGGQREVAVASKLYEYSIMGLVSVVTNRPAQRDFVRRAGVGVFSPTDDVDEILDGMLQAGVSPEVLEEKLGKAVVDARRHFTWESGSAPSLRTALERLTVT